MAERSCLKRSVGGPKRAGSRISDDSEARLCIWYGDFVSEHGHEPRYQKFEEKIQNLSGSKIDRLPKWKSNFKTRHLQCWQIRPPAAPLHMPSGSSSWHPRLQTANPGPSQWFTGNVGCTFNSFHGSPKDSTSAPRDHFLPLQAHVQPQQASMNQSPHPLQTSPASSADSQASSNRGSHPSTQLTPMIGEPFPQQTDQVAQRELVRIDSESQATDCRLVSSPVQIPSTNRIPQWTTICSPSHGEHLKNFQIVNKVRTTLGWYKQLKEQGSCPELGLFFSDLRLMFDILELLTPHNELPFSEDGEASLVDAKKAGRPAIIMKSIEDVLKETAIQAVRAVYGKHGSKEPGSIYDPLGTKGKGENGMRKLKPSEVPQLFQKRHEQRSTLTGYQERSLSTDGYGAENPIVPPMNCLNLQGQNVPPMPRCLSDGRNDILRLVQNHLDDPHRLERNDKQAVKRKNANRWIQDLGFLLVSMEDSISPWHTDRHAVHTLISPCVGEKLWIMLSFKKCINGLRARNRFHREGVNFDVKRAISGEECDIWYTIVEPGTCMIMFDSVPHMVYTLSDCVCKGKGFTDAGEMIHWLKRFRREFKYNAFAEAINEDPAPDTLEALTAMRAMLEEQALRTYGVREEDETAVGYHLERAMEAAGKMPTPVEQLDLVSESETDSELEGAEGKRVYITSKSVEYLGVKDGKVKKSRKRKR